MKVKMLETSEKQGKEKEKERSGAEEGRCGVEENFACRALYIVFLHFAW
jgi:hypothetical protein